MKTIRRLYFYLVALISLEVVIWGLINLLRTMFSSGLTFPGADTLAQALALIFVGVPIFSVHWLWAQKNSASDPEEHSAGLRALFFYLVLMMTLIPVVQNLLALINRSILINTGIESYRAFVGGTQTWIDNIIAIMLNLLAAGYFYKILGENWKSFKQEDSSASGISQSDGYENFANIRRVYRFLWVLYGLLMTIFGTQQAIRFLFYLPTTVLGSQGREMCINGLALILVGTTVWIYSWNLCQKAISEQEEQYSTVRIGILYILALAGVMVVLTTSGIIINLVLEQLLGFSIDLTTLISKLGMPLSVGLPFAVVWAYYGKWLSSDISTYKESTQRAALKRFYLYILSIAGLVTSFVGLALLMSFVISILTSNAVWGETLRPRLSSAIATLLAGLPLWLAAWRPMQAEAQAGADTGDHARRSLIRKAYLYLAIFSTVIGGMASAIYLVYTILFGFLDHRSPGFLTDVLNGVQLLVLFVAFLVYHWSVLRQDNSHAATTLSTRQENFAVLVFESHGTGFAAGLVDAIKKASSSIPVAVQPIEQGVPEGTNVIQAVILPSSLAIDPPEALRVWLKNFTGFKLVIPINQKGWYWVSADSRYNPSAAAQIIRDRKSTRLNSSH